MDKIEIELNLNSITDTMKSLSDGIKELRSAKLIDIEGQGISVTIACTRENHFLRDWDKSKFIDTGTFVMTLTGPTVRQASIDDYGDNEDEETEGPKTKGELVDDINETVLKPTLDEYATYQEDNIEATNEALEANIFESENAPKKAYYNRDGKTHKTKAFEEYLEME